MNDSLFKTFAVAFGLCVVCSVVVATAAVVLKPVQERNKLLDKQRNILVAAGLLKPNESASAVVIAERFKSIHPIVIDIATGEVLDGVDATTLDTRKESADPSQSRAVDASGDTAKVRRIPNRAAVYLVEKDGHVERYVFPIYGKGLWSTMYGFIALESDLTTVAGITFYDHGETPGLGGEIANPRWQAMWDNKKVFGSDAGVPEIAVVRNGTPQLNDHQIDGIAGATLTGNGVTGTVKFWLGQNGYGKYIALMKSGK
ncbi:MAG: Na(+)-translocating NADH-quinone reductase subunit C [Thermoguttaceae bacterium]